MLTIFANFRIDTAERLEKMKRSFYSFHTAKIKNWVLNIRGDKKNEAKEFLEKNITQNFKIFTYNSPNGWFYDSKNLCSNDLSEYIFCWNEDHINIDTIDKFNFYLEKIKKNNIDQFIYSWFHLGNLPKSFEIDELKKDEDLLFVNYDYKLHKKRLEKLKKEKLIANSYIITLLGIFKKNLFLKIINSNDPFIKRWSKYTPFDFEKNNYDIHWLPFKLACPNKEFFACIDDDNGQDGYSLNNRGKNIKKNKIIDLNIKNKTLIRIVFLILRYPFSKVWIICREFINRIYAYAKYFKFI